MFGFSVTVSMLLTLGSGLELGLGLFLQLCYGCGRSVVGVPVGVRVAAWLGVGLGSC